MPFLRLMFVVAGIAGIIVGIRLLAGNGDKVLGVAPLLVGVLAFVAIWIVNELERLRERVAKLEAHEAKPAPVTVVSPDE
jgi:hypothetical protein